VSEKQFNEKTSDKTFSDTIKFPQYTNSSVCFLEFFDIHFIWQFYELFAMIFFLFRCCILLSKWPSSEAQGREKNIVGRTSCDDKPYCGEYENGIKMKYP
jgi:hypothetical protein